MLLEHRLADRVTRSGVGSSRDRLPRWQGGRGRRWGRWWRGCRHDITRLLWGLQDNGGLEHGSMRVRTICRWLAGETHVAKLRTKVVLLKKEKVKTVSLPFIDHTH